MSLDIEYIRETYQRMSDRELLLLAAGESNQLTEEAREALKEELSFRRLTKKVEKAIEVNTKGFQYEDLDSYLKIIRSLPCPVCNKTDQALNAVRCAEATAFII